jgi:outer membrane protein assembly factor BamB
MGSQFSRHLVLLSVFGFSFISIFLLISSSGCKESVTDPPPDEKPAGYQEDIPWPSLADSPWPMFQHDPQNSGRSPFRGPQSGILSKVTEWEYYDRPSFLLADNTSLYLAARLKPDSAFSGTAAAIVRIVNGEQTWYLNICNVGYFEIHCSPLMASDGTIYAASTCGYLVSITPDGEIDWMFDAEGYIETGYGGINIDKAGNIYFSTVAGLGTGYFFSVSKTGTLNWKSARYYKQQAVISPDNIIYVKSNETIDAIDINGNLLWSFPLQTTGEYVLYLLSDSKGNLYFRYTDTSIVSLSKNGTKRWEYSVQADIIESSVPFAIDRKGTICFAGTYKIYSVDYEGRLNWELDIAGAGASPLVTDNEGTIYFAAERGKNIYAVDSSGNIKWKISDQDFEIEGSLIMNKGEELYFAAYKNIKTLLYEVK